MPNESVISASLNSPRKFYIMLLFFTYIAYHFIVNETSIKVAFK
jgi:hypothetical protein